MDKFLDSIFCNFFFFSNRWKNSLLHEKLRRFGERELKGIFYTTILDKIANYLLVSVFQLRNYEIVTKLSYCN